MLEQEGFAFGNYIDIFDGGPTMIAPTDAIRTIREARTATVIAAHDASGEAGHIVASGRLSEFRATLANVRVQDEGISLNPQAMTLLGVEEGSRVTYAPI